MVFGFQLSFSRVGSSISFYLMMPIYKFVNTFSKGHTGLAFVILFASITCVASLISSIILSVMDKTNEKRKQQQNPTPETSEEEEKIHITDVKNFRANFWILSIICVMYYLTVFPFVGLAQVFFKRKYGLSDDDANSVNSWVYLIAAFISPLCGFLVDRTGRNLMWISLGKVSYFIFFNFLKFKLIFFFFLGTLLTFAAHALITFTIRVSPW